LDLFLVTGSESINRLKEVLVEIESSIALVSWHLDVLGSRGVAKEGCCRLTPVLLGVPLQLGTDVVEPLLALLFSGFVLIGKRWGKEGRSGVIIYFRRKGPSWRKLHVIYILSLKQNWRGHLSG